MQLADRLDAGEHGTDQPRLDELGEDGVVLLEDLDGQTFVVSIDLLIKGLELVNQVLVLSSTISLLELLWHRATADVDTVVTVERAQLTD